MLKAVKPKAEDRLKVSIKTLKDTFGVIANIGSTLQWKTNGRVTASIQVVGYQDSVELSYFTTINGQSHLVIDVIMLDKTPCNYGGYRQWFICPSCGRRVGVLYMGQKHFACRKCLNLAYESQCESTIDSYNRRLTKYRRKLNWYGENEPIRPRYMHHATFKVLRNEAVQAYGRSMFRLNKMLARFENMVKKR